MRVWVIIERSTAKIIGVTASIAGATRVINIYHNHYDDNLELVLKDTLTWDSARGLYTCGDIEVELHEAQFKWFEYLVHVPMKDGGELD